MIGETMTPSSRRHHPLLGLFLVIMTLLFSFSVALAQDREYPDLGTAPQVEQVERGDIAVIVAVENYLMLPSVGGAVETANDWELFFRDGLGLKEVHLLVDQQATNLEMERFAKMVAEEAEPGARVWWIFVGHGAPAPDGADGLMVGVDAQQNPESLVARGLPQQTLLDLLNQGKQGETILIVDACFSGRTGDGSPLVAAQPVFPSMIAPVVPEEKINLVFSAAQSTEYAGPLPGWDRPSFSYLLLGALRGWASANEEITAGDALHFTRRALRGIPGRFQQTPDLSGSEDLVLVRGTAESDPGIAALLRQSPRAESESPEIASAEPLVQAAAPAEESSEPRRPPRPSEPELFEGPEGSLTISSTPPGQEVFLNGRPIGETPLRRHSLSPGIYQIRVGEDCDFKVLEEVTIHSERERTLQVHLDRAQIRVNVTSEEGNMLGSEIYVDGALLGRAPRSVQVPLCAERLEVRSPGFITHRESLSLETNPIGEFNFVLRR